MIPRFRIFLVLAVVAAAITNAIVAPTAIAAAEPIQSTAVSKSFNIHVRLLDNKGDRSKDNCYAYNIFSREGSRCGKNGYYDAGHTAGFNDVPGNLYYGGIPEGTELIFTTRSGSTVKGKIPSRGSGDFTITEFNVPGFGTPSRPNQKLHLNVTSEGFGLTGDAWQDFYLSGNIDVLTPVTGDSGGLFGDVLDRLADIFASGSASTA
ncbi:hypothetical protein [Rhodococcus sp. 24CO]|uniref:hypothetical protein n=1 Tax=Rhodococcus sp. 24CO TaxID=3117460 RepID=UPI003D32F001